MDENEISSVVVDCALKLHKALGPGLLESVYEVILAKELEKRGLKVKRQVLIPITFNGETFDQGFRADLIIEDKVIIELKSVENLSPVAHKQLLTYLKLTNLKLGLVLNFGESLMKQGTHRVINGIL